MVKIQASLVLEIMGRPKENVEEALKTIVTKMGAEKGMKVMKNKYHEPNAVEKSDLFTSFAEVEVEVESVIHLLKLIFAYMPSHIEITSPEKITLSNADLNDLGNGLLQRLHHYDAVTKTVLAEKNAIAAKLMEIAPHLFKKVEPQKSPATEEKKEQKKKSR